MLPVISWKRSQLILIRSVRCETQLYTFQASIFLIASIISILMSDGRLDLVRHMEMMMVAHLVVPLMIWLFFYPLELFVA